MKSLLLTTSLPLVLSQGLRQATGGPEPTKIVQWYPTPEPEISNCTAELITELCDYKDPMPFAVASSGYKHCWEYCDAHQPCSFVIFAKGNPYTGTGTCWLYPGEEFDKSAGKDGCDYLSVYGKPTCAGSTATTEGACTATASPSAVAELCDYPTPDDECWSTCTASGGAVDCLSQCVESEGCNYAVFNPRTESLSPYSSGTCWMYPNGTFDATKGKKCEGKTEQYVYENPCPKAAASSAASSLASASKSGSEAPKETGKNDENKDESGGNGGDANAEGAAEGKEDLTKTGSAVSTGYSLGSVFAVGMGVFMALMM